MYIELNFLTMIKELCLQNAKAIPIGKDKNKLQIVRKIVSVKPPQFLVITGVKPIPPYSKKTPKGILLIQPNNKFLLIHFLLKFRIERQKSIKI